MKKIFAIAMMFAALSMAGCCGNAKKKAADSCCEKTECCEGKEGCECCGEKEGCCQEAAEGECCAEQAEAAESAE